MYSPKGETLLKGRPQGSFLIFCIIFLIFTLAHSIPPQKSRNALDSEGDLHEAHGVSKQGWWSLSHHFLSKSSSSNESSSNRNTSRSNFPRSKREMDDFLDFDEFGFDENKDKEAKSEEKVETEMMQSLVATTLPPRLDTSLSSDDIKLRTVRETDDEDLIVSGDEEGSADPVFPTRKPGHHRRFYRVTVTIEKEWTETLTTKTSSTFRRYESEIEKSIKEHTTLDPESISVVEFSKSSSKQNHIKCKFDMATESETLTKQEIEEEFEGGFKVGKIGQLKVKRDDFSVRDIGAPLEPHCFDDELTCRNGDCVSLTFRCDGKMDCNDGTDEDGCPELPKPPEPAPGPTLPPVLESSGGCRADDQTRCSDGVTIICDEQKCDGKKDCPGNDDELNCNGTEDPCPYGQYQCDLNKCKGNETRCNGVQDCDDGIDETDCPSGRKGGKGRHCGAFEWQCRSGDCIPRENKCDGIPTCEDFSDESYCQCLPFEWECESGDCISRNLYCDGIVDCFTDKSDEKYCQQFTCIAGEFRCRNGECIPLRFRCNFIFNCEDKSDELLGNCPCKEFQFRCGTGLCIPAFQRCNGVNNCQDMSDELNCTKPTTCLPTQFRCSDGTCIPEAQRCNRRQECPDSSDESGCPPSCAVDQFVCSDGKCLNIGQRCDFKTDCDQGEDEFGCPPPDKCSGSQFTCKDMSCVGRDLVCDSYEDCPDGSDESAATCPGCAIWQVRCGDGTCISKTLSCNGRFDCLDGIDETNCTRCKPDDFECGNGGCIDKNKVCDYIPDCGDGSDEADEKCHEVCGVDDVLCGDGKCVSYTRKCDSVYDCFDGTDERGCENPQPPEPPACRTGDFRCGDGSCIEDFLRCNGRAQCTDGSDEINCPRCTNSFRCSDGKCIDNSLKCNGRNECSDGSDESDCRPSCRSGQFQCGDGQCVEDYVRCDGVTNCNDQLDELNCDHCQNSFRCTEGRCIPNEFKCNGRNDCQDGVDERDCSIRPYPFCPEDEAPCKNGECILKWFHCDGKVDCYDGSDEEDCSAHIPPLCYDDEWTCRNGDCIPTENRCDKIVHCFDKSDEEGCPAARCQSDEFQCLNGTCIENVFRCDGDVDCSDGSDEKDCVTCKDSFQCSSGGKCIANGLICDGKVDCPDGRDERDCKMTCKPNHFQCENAQCIPIAYKCDNITDCADGSDEIDCGSAVITPPCTDDEFKCQTGACVPRSSVCNSVINCPDGSDEYPQNCPACRPNQFRCGNGICLPAEKRCNKIRDCNDNIDELNCPISPCLPGEFSCRSRDQCIKQSAVCDGHYNCNDFSDEDKEHCERVPEGLNLKTYPPDQTIKRGNEVVFQCRDEGSLRAPVRWSRGSGLPLPPGSRDLNGRLEIPSVAVEHTGTYICEALGIPATTPGSKVSVYLRVDHYEPPPTRPPTACALHEATCGNGDCIPKSAVCDGDYDCVDKSDERRCPAGDGCEPNEFQCANKRCVPKNWLCDGDNDCGDSTDESNCTPPPPGSPCRYNEFKCARVNQCIPKAFQCDQENDCSDLSDEFGCSRPTIEIPPPPLVTVDVGDVFNISCRTRGIPTPEVIWRLNWGHVPVKCESRSLGGFGVLTCPAIQINEQGAYSCEAINSLGSTFAIPDCTLVVKPPGTVCPEGFFNDEAISPRECLSCFCFGHTSHCGSVSLYSSPLPPPEVGFRMIGVSRNLADGTFEIQERRNQIPVSVLKPLSPAGIRAQLFNVRTLALPTDVIPYFALPPSYNGNHIRSYGGNLRYTLSYRGTGGSLNAPDIIISGNGQTLLYIGRPHSAGRDNEITVRYWAGNWFKRVQNSNGVEPASREEILLVLSKLDHLLIRAQYDQGSLLDTNVTNIVMDSASTRNAGTGQATNVEECRCPPGYTGLSCEECAPGYQRRQEGPWLGVCVRAPVVDPCPPGTYSDFSQCRQCPCPGAGKRFGTSCYKDTDGGITCSCNPGHIGRNCEDCAPGYERNPSFPHDCRPAGSRCDVEGSLTPTPDPFTGRCVCKDMTTGALCNECKANTFHLSSLNQYGCINCFCMGITNECSSSNWYRLQESAVFYHGNHGFTLTDEAQRETITNGISSDRDSRELSYKGFSQLPTRIYYWQLPYNFLGDKVTAYGGYLNYTVRYIPPPGGQNSPNNAAEVEINGNDIRLLYYRKATFSPNRAETISIPFLEQYWQRNDGQLANREHLLMALANLESLLIKATYTTSTRESYLSDVVMDYAVSRNTGQDRAFSVEQCACPQGYVGLSCQECAFGYTRSLRGLYLGLCEPCSCNGQSEECDSKTGVCKNCRGHTSGDFCENCEDGYIGDPRSGYCIQESEPTCDCDPRGSSRQDCPDGVNCVCKGNVEGPKCTLCRSGTFALQAANPLGCLMCFCSGVSNECASASLYRLTIGTQLYAGAHEFTLTDRFRTTTIQDIIARKSEDELMYTYPKGSLSESLYWSLPSKFTGNRVGSYGGFLKATRRYSVRTGGDSIPQEDIDVILFGKNGISLFYALPGSMLPGQSVKSEVPLKESAGWRHESARMASREDLMSVLADLEAILIRATFADNMEATHIKDITLDDAVRQYTPNGVVVEVEECRCPSGYDGGSCESCATNFYRDPTDRSRSPYGSCVQCPCSANSEGCRYEGGRPICICRAGYAGPNCETRGGTAPIVPPLRPPTGPEIQVTISEPVSQNVQVGRPVSFRCSARSLSGNQLRITWSKEGGIIPAGRARDDGRGLLVVSDVRQEDAGSYICTATDGYNRNSQRAALTVGRSGGSGPLQPVESRPEVTINPTFLNVQVGESVEFRCSATGYPPPRLSWSGGRSGSLLPHVRVDGGILTIPVSRKLDEAEYFCTAENIAGSGSLRTLLYVRDDEGETKPQPPFGFIVTISPSHLDARPGETVRFRCDSSDRQAQISWAKLGGTMTASADQTVDGLTLHSVRESDAGVYVCTATPPSGQAAQSQARLTVSYVGSPPEARIEPERQTVPQGTQIEARCIATGTPNPAIQWSKVGGTLQPNIQTTKEVLLIPNARVEDRGVYVCTVENSVGKSLASAIVEVERREPPQIELYPGAQQTVLKDASALFQCRIIAGIPSPTVTWSRPNGQLLPSNCEELQGGAIRFNRVTGDEKGQYICTAENPAGTTSATAVLEIQVPPRLTLTPSSPHRVRGGEQVRLECRADGDPLPTVSWKKLRPGQLEGEVLRSTHDAFGSPQVAIYEINRVSKLDEGSYSCTGRNDAGTEEGRLQLLVDMNGENELEPQPSRPMDEVYRFPVNSRAEIRCFQTVEGGLFDQLYLDWERTDGGPMPRDYHARDGVLYINDVRLEDAGRYSCTGTNQQGQTVLSVDATLEVIGGSPPRIQLQPAQQVVRRGDTVNINCIAAGDEPITITWFKANQQPFPPSVIVNGPQITFRGIEVTDAGRYACRATNLAGSAEAVAEVIVNNGPSVSRPVRREQTGFAGTTAELRCSSARGGSRVTWRKDGGSLPVTAIPLGSMLTLMNLKLSDAGRYSCETQEGSEYIEFSVEVASGGRTLCNPGEFMCQTGDQCIPGSMRCDGEIDCISGEDEIGCWNSHNRQTRGADSVRVHISASKDLLQVGEDVEVRCDVSGDRNPIIRWTKVRGTLGENVQTFGNLLRVTDVAPENGGVYRCVAITKSGVFEDDYALTIQANPDIPLNSENIETKTAPLGTTVVMDCRTDLDLPIVYTWSKSQGHISAGGHAQGSILTIPDLSPDDAGTYVCTASNYQTSVDIPTVLVVNGVVPYFTQAPVSYMILPTLSESYLTFDIQISFKPEDKNGLLLYNGQKRDGSGDFISFGLSNGFPEFRFDVGSGPAVIRADQSVNIGKWHTVKLTRDKSGGSMTVNDQGPYVGNVRGKFQGLDLIEPLHVGGVPNFNQIHRLTGHTKGFVGCVSELILGGKKQHLLRDSQTSRGISTCDTCVVNSCRNGGVCQEGLTSRGYTCICQPGYAGDDCEISGQACFLGACGTGKCINILGGFECYCPFGKTGVRCERDVVIFDTDMPSFSGDSYMSYPTPKALKKFKMALKVKPISTSDGLLMYSSQTETGNGDYTSLSVKDGHLEFQYDMGSGPALIRSKRAINPGEWLEISVERDAQDGELTVGKNDVTKGKSPGQTRGLNLNTPLYLGGYDRHRMQLNSNVKVYKGFKGCVSGLTVAGVELKLNTSLLEGANIDKCDLTEDACTKSPCQNSGTCHVLDNTFKCSCLKGFHGRSCEEVMNFTHSVAFRGEGYLELSNDLLPHINPSEDEVIEVEISTKKQHGLILWHGQSPTELIPDDFLAVGLSEGKVEFTWDLGSGEATAISRKRVDDGQKHIVILRRQGVDGSVQVDDDPQQFAISRGLTQTLNTRGNIYLGGTPNPLGMTQGKYGDGFVGCIHALRIQDNITIDLNSHAISAVNTGPCLSNLEESSPKAGNEVPHTRPDAHTFYDYEDENDAFDHVGRNRVN